MNDVAMGAFARWLGVEMDEWREDHVRMSMKVRPEMLNRSGILHGGVLTSLIDTAGGYAGTWCRKPGHIRQGLTLSLTTQFTGQAKSGTITAVAERRGGGRKTFFVDVSVTDEAGREIAYGSGVWRYRSGHEDPDGVPLAEVRAPERGAG
ncbi:MAG: PaaI family thioesterase [Geminicoccaceae bacterium]|nr:PaaI family thioesterase [Geminicoccaceae bacterium]